MQSDRNTLLLIVIVLTISVVSLVVVLVISWRLVGGFITSAIQDVSRYVHLQNLDYNFEIPDKE